LENLNIHPMVNMGFWTLFSNVVIKFIGSNNKFTFFFGNTKSTTGVIEWCFYTLTMSDILSNLSHTPLFIFTVV
jgi:hypothetical protein